MNIQNQQWFDLPGNHGAAVILGMGPQALFLLRCLRNQYRNVYLVGEKNWIGYLSRFGEKIVVNKSGIKGVLESILKKHGKQIPIFISGGSTLRYYVQNSYLHELNIYPRPLSAINILNDKKRLYEYILSNNYDINLITTMPFNEKNDYHYPLILKWSTEPDVKKFKTLTLYNSEDYYKAYNMYGIYKNQLILQYYIENKLSIAYAAFALNGNASKEVVVNQERQYPTGLTNYISKYDDDQKDEIIKLCRSLIYDFKYTGFIEFEFLMDMANRTLYFIECNPRPWGWIDYMNYDNGDEGVEMVNVLRDSLFLLKTTDISISLKFKKMYRNYFAKKVIWDIKDPFPIIGQVINQLYGKND